VARVVAVLCGVSGEQGSVARGVRDMWREWSPFFMVCEVSKDDIRRRASEECSESGRCSFLGANDASTDGVRRGASEECDVSGRGVSVESRESSGAQTFKRSTCF